MKEEKLRLYLDYMVISIFNQTRNTEEKNFDGINRILIIFYLVTPVS